LVTGGAGFLGSHLCDRLIAAGARVLCLDDGSTGSSANLAHLAEDPRFTMHWADVRVPLGELRVDRIFHLACPASPVQYQKDPVRTLTTNVSGTISVLELARRTGARVLLASTSEVYGDPLIHPQREEYFGNVDPIGIRACYDEGKRCAETLCMDYHRQHGVEVRIARIFNTYGPRMRSDDGRVVSNFIVQALAGQDVTVYGDGTQTRSFCYVTDLVEGLLRLMEASDLTGPINLGRPEELTVRAIAELIVDLVGGDSRIVYRPLPSGDPVRRRPDITRARERLDWEPATSLRAGLPATIASFRERVALSAPPVARRILYASGA
jgi:UDP-glucuronate decarboxylase